MIVRSLPSFDSNRFRCRASRLEPRRARRRAFSLIELLVASSIMVVMVGLIVTLTASILGEWNRQTGSFSRQREAQFALDRLEQDLMGLMVTDSAEAVYVGEPETVVFSGESFPVVKMRFCSQSSQSGIAPENAGTAAIAYAVLAENPLHPSSPAVPSLFRAVVRGNRVTEEFWGNLDTPANAGLTPFLDSQSAYPKASAHLLTGVVGFNLRWYFSALPSSPGNPREHDIRTSGVLKIPQSGSGEWLGKPQAVDIEISLLDQEGQDILANRQEFSALTLEEILLQHSQTFTRRIPLK
jgi:prepilin-type N-terminal cleavage/methylation domain-containing protein